MQPSETLCLADGIHGGHWIALVSRLGVGLFTCQVLCDTASAAGRDFCLRLTALRFLTSGSLFTLWLVPGSLVGGSLGQHCAALSASLAGCMEAAASRTSRCVGAAVVQIT